MFLVTEVCNKIEVSNEAEDSINTQVNSEEDVGSNTEICNEAEVDKMAEVCCETKVGSSRVAQGSGRENSGQ